MRMLTVLLLVILGPASAVAQDVVVFHREQLEERFPRPDIHDDASGYAAWPESLAAPLGHLLNEYGEKGYALSIVPDKRAFWFVLTRVRGETFSFQVDHQDDGLFGRAERAYQDARESTPPAEFDQSRESFQMQAVRAELAEGRMWLGALRVGDQWGEESFDVLCSSSRFFAFPSDESVVWNVRQFEDAAAISRELKELGSKRFALSVLVPRGPFDTEIALYKASKARKAYKVEPWVAIDDSGRALPLEKQDMGVVREAKERAKARRQHTPPKDFDWHEVVAEEMASALATQTRSGWRWVGEIQRPGCDVFVKP